MVRPLVSVGVPVHNGMPHIEATLRACLDDVDGLEVVVSDNASTDGTSEVVRDLAVDDPRLRHEPTDDLLPVLDNFRRCVALTSGEFFRWNGADDWPGPGLQAAALGALRSRPDAKTLGGFFQYFWVVRCLRSAFRHEQANGLSYAWVVRTRPDVAFFDRAPPCVVMSRRRLVLMAKEST